MARDRGGVGVGEAVTAAKHTTALSSTRSLSRTPPEVSPRLGLFGLCSPRVVRVRERLVVCGATVIGPASLADRQLVALPPPTATGHVPRPLPRPRSSFLAFSSSSLSCPRGCGVRGAQARCTRCGPPATTVCGRHVPCSSPPSPPFPLLCLGHLLPPPIFECDDDPSVERPPFAAVCGLFVALPRHRCVMCKSGIPRTGLFTKQPTASRSPLAHRKFRLSAKGGRDSGRRRQK